MVKSLFANVRKCSFLCFFFVCFIAVFVSLISDITLPGTGRCTN